jgi:hypothetical protein
MAAEYLRRLGPRALTTPNPPAKVAVAAVKRPAAASKAVPAAPGSPDGLINRISITPPLFNHPAVSKATIEAARQAIAALPRPLRAKLDASTAQVIISPNIFDRWPDSLKDLPENDEAPTLAELPGRIYGQDMVVYERAKVRGSTVLKESRAPAYIRLQVANMCFQLLDDMMTISKDPALRAEWEGDKGHIPASMEEQLGTFMKADDWGPRETCSELFGAMLGGHDENTDNLYRYFPHTKRWLAAKLGVAG